MKHPLTAVHIVLVEDNPADVYLVKRALREKRIEFVMTCFEDGEKALKALSGGSDEVPDIILLDLNLPITNGVEVLETIRAIPELADVPVAILTSSESPSDMERATVLRAARYIKKPSTLDDFMREVGQGVESMLNS